jgi:patatin-like phospholipase/acyl hydrolase
MISKHPRIASFLKIIKRLKKGWMYPNDSLRDAFVELFGEKTLADSECLLCIPSYSLTEGRPFIFKWNHPEGKLTRDNRFKYVDVALATSAAPMYFPKMTFTDPTYEDFISYQFIDGGVYANNPSMIGLTEALHYFVGKDKEFDSLALLSVASLNESAAEEHSPNIQLDAASPDAINLMRTKGYEQALLYIKMDAVLKFLEHRKHYLTNRKDSPNG